MNNSIMYWMYHIDDPSIQDEIMYDTSEFKDGQTLYAYTDEKKVAKVFRKQRDMNIFREEKIAMSREDVNYLATDHLSLRLTSIEGITKLNHGDIYPYTLALTNWEVHRVSMESAYYEATIIPKAATISQSLLYPEYRYILHKIKYWYYYDPSYHKALVDMENLKSTVQRMDEPVVDFLVIFLKLFAILMKEKKS